MSGNGVRKYPKERDTCRVAGAAGVPTAKIAFFAEMQARAGYGNQVKSPFKWGDGFLVGPLRTRPK